MNKVVWPLLAPPGIALFILLLPVILPFVALTEWWVARQKRAVAARFPCARCGALLGDVSLSLADAAWDERLQQWHRDNPDVQFRFVRTLHAVCPHCGQQYTYLEKERTFVEEARDDDARREA